MGIFKAYDIRGVVPDELDTTLAKKIGNGFARLLKAKKLVVGQDMRVHSPDIADGFLNTFAAPVFPRPIEDYDRHRARRSQWGEHMQIDPLAA